MKEKLCHNNFMLYAMKMYNNPVYTGAEEFREDMLRIKYIKRLLVKYKKRNDLKERLILNHLIILQNVFGAEACTRILFYRINKELHSCLKSFLEYLQYLPSYIPEAELHLINSDHRISIILEKLR